MSFIPESARNLVPNAVSTRVSSAAAFFEPREVRGTLAYCYGFFLFGLMLAGVGPSLLELGRRTDSSVSTMSFLYTARSLGFVAGASLSGQLFPRVKGGIHRVVAGFQALAIVGCVLIPLGSSVPALLFAMLLQGFGMGGMETGVNVSLLWLFAEVNASRAPEQRRSVDPFMQFLHCTFALGALVAPLMVGSSLSDFDTINPAFYAMAAMTVPQVVLFVLWRSPDPKVGEAALAEETRAQSGSAAAEGDEEAEKGNGAAAAGAVSSSSASASSSIEEPSPVGRAGFTLFGQSGRRLAVLVLTGAFLLVYVGAEVGAGGFIYTYAVEMGLLGEVSAANLNSVFWAALALGRLLGVWIATRLSAERMIELNLVGCVVAIVIVLADRHSQTALWIGIIAYGLAMSSMYPAAVVLGNTYLGHITGAAASVFVIGASIGELLVPLVCSALFKIYSVRTLFPIMLVVALIAFGVYGALRFNGRIVLAERTLSGRARPATAATAAGKADAIELGRASDDVGDLR